MLIALDGPAKQYQLNVSSSVVKEVVETTTVFDDRKVVTLLPIDGKIWIFLGDGVNTPTVSDVKTKGFPGFKNAFVSFEAGVYQPIWIVADTSTVDVRIAERG